MLFSELTLIRSKENKNYKYWAGALSTARAKKEEIMLVEGERQVAGLLQLKEQVKAVILLDNEQGEQKYAQHHSLFTCPFYRVSVNLYKKLSSQDSPQAIMFLLSTHQLISELSAFDPCARYCICENINDPGNLGTMIRTADALAFDAVVFLGDCVSAFNPKLVKSSVGSLFNLKLYTCDYEALKQDDLNLIVADLEGENLEDYRLKSPGFALLMGNEAQGVSGQAKELAKTKISIEMPGQAESLNVALAFGIIAYNLRQKSKRG